MVLKLSWPDVAFYLFANVNFADFVGKNDALLRKYIFYDLRMLLQTFQRRQEETAGRNIRKNFLAIPPGYERGQKMRHGFEKNSSPDLLPIKSGCSCRFFRAAPSPKRWEIASWSKLGRFLSIAVMLSMITEYNRLRKK
jgi:activator of HSP90 ATPase